MRFLFANNTLCDCELALELLENERNQNIWRVHWVGAVALIRAVGHVLRYVDRKEHPQFSEKIDGAFDRWKTDPQHRIFRDVIDSERNNVLKEYRSSIHELGIVRLTVEQRPSQLPITWETNEGGELTKYYKLDYYELDENMYRPRMSSFMEGEDARGIYKAAIDWWRTELSKIVS